MSTRNLRFHLRKSAPCSRQDGPRLAVAARSIHNGSRPMAMPWHAHYFIIIQRRLQSRVRRSGKAWKRPCSKTRRFKKDAFNHRMVHGDFVRRNKSRMDDYIILNYLSHQLTKIKSSRLIEIQNIIRLRHTSSRSYGIFTKKI